MSGFVSNTIYFTAPYEVELRTEQVTPSSEELVLESELIGVSCGTELLLYRGEFPSGASEDNLSALSSDLNYPAAYGYMNVARDAEGNRYFAFAPHADRFAAPADSLISIGELPAEDAIFAASMETALGIVHDSQPVAGEHVLVSGQGVIGLLVTELLMQNRLLQVYVAEPNDFRRRQARALGAHVLEKNTAYASQQINAETEERGLDVAIDVSGSESALQFALDHLAFEGRLMEGSWFGTKTSAVRLGGNFHRRRVSIQASQVSNIAGTLAARWSKQRRMAFVLELLGRIRPAKYITHRFSLQNCAAAYRLIGDSQTEVLQPVFVPQQRIESDGS